VKFFEQRNRKNKMNCPHCNSNFKTTEELNEHRREVAIINRINMTPQETENRERAWQALFDLEELRAIYPGF